jgi:hypothetical protein
MNPVNTLSNPKPYKPTSRMGPTAARTKSPEMTRTQILSSISDGTTLSKAAQSADAKTSGLPDLEAAFGGPPKAEGKTTAERLASRRDRLVTEHQDRVASMGANKGQTRVDPKSFMRK